MDRHRDNAMDHCADMFYSTIGLVKNKSRTQDQVKARAALAVSMLDYGIQEQVAAVIGKNRSTVAHMKRNHGDWLLYWKGYKDLYETAFRISKKILGKQSCSEHINNINEKIRFLEAEKEILESQLNTQIEL
jgi:hypothetical protein